MNLLSLLCFLPTLLLGTCQPKEKSMAVDPAETSPFKVLVFTKTAGFRHESIPAGIAAIRQLGVANGFSVDATEDAALFTKENLSKYQVVVFLSTTLDVLDGAQQAAFEQYIRSGGGFVGIHAAADTEYDWPWYGKLVGGYFNGHPPGVTEAAIHVKDKKHPACEGLPDTWKRTDEWYNYKELNPDIHVLCTLDESTYEGGTNGPDHPIAWYHAYEGGRAFYTGSGHTSEAFAEPLFLRHLLGGIQYAAGRSNP